MIWMQRNDVQALCRQNCNDGIYSEMFGMRRVIRQLTADRRNGMCAPCHRNAGRPPEERFANEVFDTIEATIKPFTGYKKALQKLQACLVDTRSALRTTMCMLIFSTVAHFATSFKLNMVSDS